MASFIASASVWKDVAVTSWSIAVPGTVAAGDLGILVVGLDATTARTLTATGWSTHQLQFNATNLSSIIMTRVMTAGETTVDMTFSGSAAGSATAFWIRGATGIAQTGTYGIRSGTTTTVTAPGITTTARRQLIALYCDRSIMATAPEVDAITALSWGTVAAQGTSNPALGASAGIPVQWLVMHEQTAAGATGDNTATMSDSAANAWGVVMALDPAATALSAYTPTEVANRLTSSQGIVVYGNNFTFAVAGQIKELRFYRYSGSVSATRVMRVWLGPAPGTLLASVSIAESGEGWQSGALSPPLSVAAGQTLLVVVENPEAQTIYRLTLGGNLVNGSLTMAQQCIADIVPGSYPTSTTTRSYFADVVFEPAPTNDLWVWNGTTEVPANVAVWNGTSEVAANIEFAS